MLDDLGVELGHSVAIRIAVVDHSVELIELADLILSIEAGQILRRHQVLSEEFRVESSLSRSNRWHAYNIRAVIDCAEDLECLLFGLADAIFAQAVLPFERVHVLSLFGEHRAKLGRAAVLVHGGY